jgi:hypothetical protein
MTPGVRNLRKAVTQKHHWSFALLDQIDANPIRVNRMMFSFRHCLYLHESPAPDFANEPLLKNTRQRHLFQPAQMTGEK